MTPISKQSLINAQTNRAKDLEACIAALPDNIELEDAYKDVNLLIAIFHDNIRSLLSADYPVTGVIALIKHDPPLFFDVSGEFKQKFLDY